VVRAGRCQPSGVNLIRDRFTVRSRGFAFVEVSNDEDADRAINSLNGQNFGGETWWLTKPVLRRNVWRWWRPTGGAVVGSGAGVEPAVAWRWWRPWWDRGGDRGGDRGQPVVVQ